MKCEICGTQELNNFKYWKGDRRMCDKCNYNYDDWNDEIEEDEEKDGEEE